MLQNTGIKCNMDSEIENWCQQLMYHCTGTVQLTVSFGVAGSAVAVVALVLAVVCCVRLRERCGRQLERP